jgi:hypothetical protein
MVRQKQPPCDKWSRAAPGGLAPPAKDVLARLVLNGPVSQTDIRRPAKA